MDIDRQVPEDFASLVTKEEYELILEHAIASISKHSHIESITNGEVHATDPDNAESKMTFSLHNIVRKCKAAPKAEWADLIDGLFGKPLFNEAKHKFFMKDFEYAEPLLKVVVRSKYAFDEASLSRLAYREDIPHTCTFLVLDYDERFHYIDTHLIEEWEQPLERLFEIGIAHVNKVKIEIDRLQIDDMKVFVLCSGDFSTPYVLQLSENFPEGVGILGAVVHIPSKGRSIVHPIQDSNPLKYIVQVMPLVEGLFEIEPNPINMRSYWYFQGKFEEFPVTKGKNGQNAITYPEGMMQFIKKAMN